MQDFPISQGVLALIAILSAMEGGLSDLMELIWAVGGTVLLSELLWKKFPLIRDLPIWSKITICVVIAVGVGFGTFYRFIRPNIYLQASNDYPYIQRDSNGTWLRVRATNRGWRAAQCKFYLNNLNKIGSNERIVRNENLLLTLGGGQGGEWEADISPDRSVYINLTNIKHGTDEITVFNSQFQYEYNGHLKAGNYEFTVSADGPNCRSGPISIRVQYSGDDNVTADISQ